jgi:hypothetical protein
MLRQGVNCSTNAGTSAPPLSTRTWANWAGVTEPRVKGTPKVTTSGVPGATLASGTSRTSTVPAGSAGAKNAAARSERSSSGTTASLAERLRIVGLRLRGGAFSPGCNRRLRVRRTASPQPGGRTAWRAVHATPVRGGRCGMVVDLIERSMLPCKSGVSAGRNARAGMTERSSQTGGGFFCPDLPPDPPSVTATPPPVRDLRPRTGFGNVGCLPARISPDRGPRR